MGAVEAAGGVESHVHVVIQECALALAARTSAARTSSQTASQVCTMGHLVLSRSPAVVTSHGSVGGAGACRIGMLSCRSARAHTARSSVASRS